MTKNQVWLTPSVMALRFIYISIFYQNHSFLHNILKLVSDDHHILYEASDGDKIFELYYQIMYNSPLKRKVGSIILTVTHYIPTTLSTVNPHVKGSLKQKKLNIHLLMKIFKYVITIIPS